MSGYRLEQLTPDYWLVMRGSIKVAIVFPDNADRFLVYPHPDTYPGLTFDGLPAPLLPESALQADARGSYVYIVGVGNKVERRDVHIGLVTDQGVAIASGLSGAERVVLRAGAFLSPGETVSPRNAPALPGAGQ